MIGFKVPTTDGRHLTIRPCVDGAGVQLGILGKRGSLVEATSIALAEVPLVITLIDEISDVAWQRFQKSVQPLVLDFDGAPAAP